MSEKQTNPVEQTLDEEGLALIKLGAAIESVQHWQSSDTITVLNATIEKLVWLRNKLIAAQIAEGKKLPNQS